jgi:hypothetical protein
VSYFIDITLVETQKTENINQGVFTFSFSPPLPPLEKYNQSNYFFFSCDTSTFQVVSWTYSANGQAVLVVNYDTDLEAQQASAVFTFQEDYVLHHPIVLNFTIRSNGTMLLFE